MPYKKWAEVDPTKLELRSFKANKFEDLTLKVFIPELQSES